jgi:hypothetical protein
MTRLSWAGTILLVTGLVATAGAEPISFEQAANVTGLAGIQIGVDADYSYEKIEAGGNTMMSALENSVMDLPIFIRFGLPILEAKLTVPYGSVKNNADAAKNQNYSGFRNIGLGLKTGLLALPVFNLAVGLNTRFPTGDPGHYIYGEGLDLNPFLAADLNVVVFKLHANVGYEYRGKYNTSFNPLTEDSSQSYTVKPGDATHYALGLEIPTGDLFTLICELNGTKYGAVQIENTTLPDTGAGMTLHVIPGIQLQKGFFRAHVGLSLPLEKQSERPELAPRDDWRILAGASLVFGL